MAALRNSYSESYGYNHDFAATSNSVMRHTLLPNGFDSQPLYDPEAYVAGILYDIDRF